MNRRQRRVSAKTPAKPGQPSHATSVETGQASPTLALRLAARLLLSAWVLRRVQSPQIFSMLRQVAIQAGRDDAVLRIDERLRQHP